MDLLGLLSNPTGPLKFVLEYVPGESSRRPLAEKATKKPSRRHIGFVVEAVVRVLADHREPMRAKDVHAAVEALMGEPVSWSSVKGALSAGTTGKSPRFVRVRHGVYRLAHG